MDGCGNKGFNKRVHSFVVSVMRDMWQMFAEQLRRKAAGVGLWVLDAAGAWPEDNGAVGSAAGLSEA